MMSINSPKSLVSKFFTNTSGSYDKVVHWTTFGKDEIWKKEILNKIHGESILDLACGTGILTRKIAQKFPYANVIGVDVSTSYLNVARINSESFKSILFIHQDAEKLELDQKFDSISSSYIPKYCDAKTLIKKCVSHLNPNGVIILHDFTYPRNIFVCMLWNLYFVLLRLIGYLIPHWKDVFIVLPKLIRSSTWLKDYISAMNEVGLDTEFHYSTWSSCAILVGRRLDNS